MLHTRLIVAGSRGWPSVSIVFKALDFLLSNQDLETVTILSGHCKNSAEAEAEGCMDSPDMMGESYAIQRGLDLEIYPANWRPYSNARQGTYYDNSAGYKRNAKMATLATHLAAFWDGKSPGTEHMIQLGQQHGLVVAIIDLKGNIERL